MQSPFPGMDPYIERFWNDVGGSLIVYISDELNTVMPPSFEHPSARDLRRPIAIFIKIMQSRS